MPADPASHPGRRPERSAPRGYGWARFRPGGGEIVPAFRCPRCLAGPAPTSVAAEAEIPEARCRCHGCGYEWHLLLTRLQALRLATDPEVSGWVEWASPGTKQAVVSRGVSAVWELAAFERRDR